MVTVTGVDNGFLPGERECAICHKRFCARDGQYAYMRGQSHWKKKWFCSYGCMREYDRRKEEKKRNKKREDVIRLRDEGKSRDEVAEMLGISVRSVDYYYTKFRGTADV